MTNRRGKRLLVAGWLLPLSARGAGENLFGTGKKQASALPSQRLNQLIQLGSHIHSCWAGIGWEQERHSIAAGGRGIDGIGELDEGNITLRAGQSVLAYGDGETEVDK